MVLRIGHRGAMGYAPENTLLSFRKALELRCDMIELDVRLCKSGELIVFHDDTLERTTNGAGPVSEQTLELLRTLDAGCGEKIPLFQEVLGLIAGKAKVDVELKGPGTAMPTARLIDRFLAQGGWSRGHFLVSSFDCQELSVFKRLAPYTAVGILCENTPAGLFSLAGSLGAYSLNISYNRVTHELVEHIHREGMKVLVWTVDSPDEIARAKEMGVDGIISNFPDRV